MSGKDDKDFDGPEIDLEAEEVSPKKEGSRRLTGRAEPMPTKPTLPKDGDRLGLVGRMESYRRRRDAEIQAKEIRARTDLGKAATEFVSTKLDYDRQLERGRAWNADQERRKIEAEFDGDEAAAKLKALDAQEELAEAEHQAELARRRRERELAPKPEAQKQKHTPRESEEERIANQLKNMLKHGTDGKASVIAAQLIADLIDEVGGKENLTDEQREFILNTKAEAQRQDLSKGK